MTKPKINKKEKRLPSTSRFPPQGRSLGKRKLQMESFLILIIVLLVILLAAESVQIFFQFKGLTKEKVVQRPVYIVEYQPIDLDAYLREYFVTKTPKKTMYVTVSAYSSLTNQTDSAPHLTAIGTPVRDGIVAANFLPIGTVIRFPDRFGEKIFLVEDRMNEKFGFQVDIWMSNNEEAKKFGIQYLKIEIF